MLMDKTFHLVYRPSTRIFGVKYICFRIQSMFWITLTGQNSIPTTIYRGGSRTAAVSKMEHFVMIVNGWKP